VRLAVQSVLYSTATCVPCAAGEDAVDAVSLLFTRQPASDRFSIEIWGEARDAVLQLFESLPFKLNRPLRVSRLERAA
jgi:hypothetical protein